MRLLLLLTACVWCLSSCDDQGVATSGQDVTQSEKALDSLPEKFQNHNGFKVLSAEETGIDFENRIEEDYNYNIINYEYLYNGGGVAIGDINNDGLPDIYFVSTFGKNRLYLNQGDYKFEDITDRSGVAAAEGFQTGVAMVDINGNGLLDIYVCRTGKQEGPIKSNLLFINNGDLTFTERAEEFGLADRSNSNHANFFDMDGDGNLDMYLLNHPISFSEGVTLRLQQQEDGTTKRLTHPQTPYESDRLYRNSGGRFVDITEEAGISNSAYGLSVVVSDINLDGRPDVFVGNDYIEPDHLFINNGDGTFTDKALDFFRSMSQHSMGADIADFTNNGLPDIVVLDMLAEDHVRYKELMNVMTVQRHKLMTEHGYGNQYVRNSLQVNQGRNSRGDIEFSEVSRMAGISNTDWSWGALFADFNNNGLKDIYIANGYLRDLTNLDYSVYIRDSISRTGGLTRSRFPDINEYLDMMPSTPLPNYLYMNNGDLTFIDVSKHWNIGEPSFSSGSAYADLNGDGHLDLVVSNINAPSFVIQNLGNNNNYLKITLNGPGNNTAGIGSKAYATVNGETQFLELNGNRGYFSTMEHKFHFGLGQNEMVDELLIVWPDGTYQKLENIPANQHIEIDYEPQGTHQYQGLQSQDLYFAERTAELGLDFEHKENSFEDFNRERLIPHRLSRLGPALEVGDINGDGLEDFFIGGAKGQAGKLFVQSANGTFSESPQAVFQIDRQHEDVNAVFFDANGNGHLDLLVASGGYSEPINDPLYNDRLYLNDGSGNFERSDAFPKIPTCSGPILVHDFEGDGNPFIFVGGRALPLNYPIAPTSYVVRKENGTYKNLTGRIFPELERLGMITEIQAADLNGDGTEELIITGEWMPIKVFSLEDGVFVDRTEEFGLDRTNGWWNTLHISDLTGDGKMEIVGGNLGLNARYTASHESPLVNLADDFDRNGMIDAIMCYYHEGELYPYPGRDLLLAQMPGLRNKFPRFKYYADATIEEVLSPEEVANAHRVEAYTMENSMFKMEGGKYTQNPFPNEAQVSNVFDILSDDFNGDGNKDLLMVGNHLWAEVESGAYDASKGFVFLGNDRGEFEFLPNRIHGLWATEEARKVRKIQLANGKQLILVANSHGPLQTFEQLMTSPTAF